MIRNLNRNDLSKCAPLISVGTLYQFNLYEIATRFEISLAKLHPGGNLQVSGHIKLAARHITCRRHLPTYSMDISSIKKQIRGIIRVACAVGSPFAQDYEADDQSARVAPAPRASRRSAGLIDA